MENTISSSIQKIPFIAVHLSHLFFFLFCQCLAQSKFHLSSFFPSFLSSFLSPSPSIEDVALLVHDDHLQPASKHVCHVPLAIPTQNQKTRQLIQKERDWEKFSWGYNKNLATLFRRLNDYFVHLKLSLQQCHLSVCQEDRPQPCLRAESIYSLRYWAIKVRREEEEEEEEKARWSKAVGDTSGMQGSCKVHGKICLCPPIPLRYQCLLMLHALPWLLFRSCARGGGKRSKRYGRRRTLQSGAPGTSHQV
jgi:hypothetical protein